MHIQVILDSPFARPDSNPLRTIRDADVFFTHLQNISINLCYVLSFYVVFKGAARLAGCSDCQGLLGGCVGCQSFVGCRGCVNCVGFQGCVWVAVIVWGVVRVVWGLSWLCELSELRGLSGL